MREYSLSPITWPLAAALEKEISTHYRGSLSRWEPLLLGLLSSLHVLMEDRPGVGKTTLAKALATVLGLDFGRIQFTPDLLPGDVVGMTVWSQEKKDFYFRPGGILHQFVLADEINRAGARTQSALLEAMQESQITVDGTSHLLPKPFFVAATQNPLNFQGTFPLPEAQLDRFGLMFTLGYPDTAAAEEVLDQSPQSFRLPPLKAITTASEILEFQSQVQKIHVSPSLKSWVVHILERSRVDSRVALGLSPRAGQHWVQAARASAFLRGRDFVVPEDILHTSGWVLTHRLLVTSQTRLDRITPRTVLESILDSQALPLK